MRLVMLAFAFVCFVVAAILNRSNPSLALTDAGLACWVATQFLV